MCTSGKMHGKLGLDLRHYDIGRMAHSTVPLLVGATSSGHLDWCPVTIKNAELGPMRASREAKFTEVKESSFCVSTP